MPLSWASSEPDAIASAHEKFRVQAELPNPINFEAATAFVTEEDMAGTFGCGPEADKHLTVAQQFVYAGFD